MSINPEKETELFNLSDKLLGTILENCYRPRHISQYQKQIDEKRENLCKNFIETLDDDQKKQFEQLESLKLDYDTTEKIYNILYGMKINQVFKTMIENPLKVIEHYQKGWEVK